MKWRSYRKDKTRRTYTVRGVDHLGIDRTCPAFERRDLSNDLARNIEKLVDYRSAGDPAPPRLREYFEGLPARIKNRLAQIGLLDNGVRPLAEHRDAFERHLRERGNCEEHVAKTMLYVDRIIEATKARHWSDVKPTDVQTAIAGLKRGTRSLSALTKNYHLRDFKAFAKWCVEAGRLAESPVAALRPLDAAKVRAERRYPRRPLTLDEARKLLDATGASSPSRSLLYRFAIETGLRSKELRALTAVSFDFDAGEVTVASAYTKNRTEARLPLRPETAALLRDHLRTRLPGASAFDVPARTTLSRVLKRDLAAAGVAVETEAGRLNFHALRHTTGSWLAAAGVHPRIIQRILRHGTISMTMDRYTHPFRVDEEAAIKKLPDLDARPRNREAATGTTGGGNGGSLVSSDVDRWSETGEPSAANVEDGAERFTRENPRETRRHAPRGPMVRGEGIEPSPLAGRDPKSRGFDRGRNRGQTAPRSATLRRAGCPASSLCPGPASSRGPLGLATRASSGRHRAARRTQRRAPGAISPTCR